MSDFLLSIVIPVYNEESQIYENIMAIDRVLSDAGLPHEFVLVDDGSRDGTWSELLRLSERFAYVNALRLSRNFGKEAALCAGLEHIGGSACVVMDSDLQHPPEVIVKMVELWRQGFEVVEGVKTSRGSESLFNKLGARTFYKLLKRSSGLNLEGASDFKLLDVKVIDAWKQMGERITFFRGMSAWVGFKRASLPFAVADRREGASKWSVFRLFKLAVNAITSFSSAPLQIVTFIGFLFLAGSLVMAVQTLYMKLMGVALSGFTTVILLLLIIGSTLMISLGIIGTYIARIFDEVKFRPRYIISESSGRAEPPEKAKGPDV